MSPIETALSRLTNDWQRLNAIKLHPASGAAGYDDLVWDGRAEVKREPVHRGGILAGEKTFYRLKKP